tara:strand:+ start:242 stop:637 length:396 start_codon:yes stop_codon:yes gene_type:complete
MTKKTRRKFTQEQKDRALEDYLSGARSAQQIAEDLQTDVQTIYRWKVAREEKAKGIRLDELVDEGNSIDQAQRILDLELELEAYQKKVAEQAVMLDLLKKSRGLSYLPQESELTGLIKTTRKLDRKKRRSK